MVPGASTETLRHRDVLDTSFFERVTFFGVPMRRVEGLHICLSVKHGMLPTFRGGSFFQHLQDGSAHSTATMLLEDRHPTDPDNVRIVGFEQTACANGLAVQSHDRVSSLTIFAIPFDVGIDTLLVNEYAVTDLEHGGHVARHGDMRRHQFRHFPSAILTKRSIPIPRCH